MKKKTNDYENFEKGMIYMKILKKGGSREKGGGGKEIYAPCACGRAGFILKLTNLYHSRWKCKNGNPGIFTNGLPAMKNPDALRIFFP
jgi:hypothetical protein